MIFVNKIILFQTDWENALAWVTVWLCVKNTWFQCRNAAFVIMAAVSFWRIALLTSCVNTVLVHLLFCHILLKCSLMDIRMRKMMVLSYRDNIQSNSHYSKIVKTLTWSWVNALKWSIHVKNKWTILIWIVLLYYYVETSV